MNSKLFSCLSLLLCNICLSVSQDPETDLDYGSLVAMMARTLGKRFPDFIERYNAQDLVSKECFISWHKFVTRTGVSADLDQLSEGAFLVENKRALLELISPDKCTSNMEGKFCKMLLDGNYKLGSRTRDLNTTFGMCFPNKCSQTDLNNLLERFSQGYKSFLNFSLKISDCGSLNDFEILSEELLEKHFENMNQTFRETVSAINIEKLAPEIVETVTSIVNSSFPLPNNQNHTSVDQSCKCYCKNGEAIVVN